MLNVLPSLSLKLVFLLHQQLIWSLPLSSSGSLLLDGGTTDATTMRSLSQRGHLEIKLRVHSKTLHMLERRSFPTLLLTPFLSLKIPFTTLLESRGMLSAIPGPALLPCLMRRAQCRKPLGCQSKGSEGMAICRVHLTSVADSHASSVLSFNHDTFAIGPSVNDT